MCHVKVCVIWYGRDCLLTLQIRRCPHYSGIASEEDAQFVVVEVVAIVLAVVVRDFADFSTREDATAAGSSPLCNEEAFTRTTFTSFPFIAGAGAEASETLTIPELFNSSRLAWFKDPEVSSFDRTIFFTTTFLIAGFVGTKLGEEAFKVVEGELISDFDIGRVSGYASRRAACATSFIFAKVCVGEGEGEENGIGIGPERNESDTDV